MPKHFSHFTDNLKFTVKISYGKDANGLSQDYTGLALEHLGKGLWGCTCVGLAIPQVTLA